jgi:hypothetical protein
MGAAQWRWPIEGRSKHGVIGHQPHDADHRLILFGFEFLK